ncbi:MFS transporter [Microlunatus soli]|uniref:Sugar phosphate permease n=1 Tax=Microlunatus soli TaxID=630515 RepID=A0A1H1XX67_9ACTN|nr:MFS transporter [Microlunatus soli]SDT13611.1 Sugar phosphate permease [Microlunatus soli]
MSDRFELSERATKKVFKRLVPFLLLMYVIAFLDRSNVSFAQEEFEVDFGISAAAYALGAGLFFVGYAIFEIPSNLLLHRVGARWWLARIMVSWGIVSSLFVFVQGPVSFYILRLLLGITEAGFFPGVILYLTYWVPARHLSRARGYFYMGIALAGMIGNPLSGGLLELNGVANLRGIQWMFLVEGVLAIAVGVWSYFFLTDRPRNATWLPDDERTALADTVEQEDNTKAAGEGPQKVLLALANWRIWYFAALYFCIQIAVYGMTFFLPTQVTKITGQELGFAAALVTAIPWVFGLASVAFFPGLADRTRRHRTIGTVLLLVTAVGIFLSGLLSGTPVLAIAGLALAAIGFVAVQPIFWTLPTEYLTGYAAAAGIGLINSLGNLGGFLAPIMRSSFDDSVGGNAGLNALALGAVAAAALLALTTFFPKANDIETGAAETMVPRSR